MYIMPIKKLLDHQYSLLKIIFIFIIQEIMKLPEHYKNLDANQKRIVVANLIAEFGNQDIQDHVNGFNDNQIDFLFTYFFTESREKRERMWYDMQTEYESTLRELEYIAEKIQKLNVEYKEYLAEEANKHTYGK